MLLKTSPTCNFIYCRLCVCHAEQQPQQSTSSEWPPYKLSAVVSSAESGIPEICEQTCSCSLGLEPPVLSMGCLDCALALLALLSLRGVIALGKGRSETFFPCDQAGSLFLLIP